MIENRREWLKSISYFLFNEFDYKEELENRKIKGNTWIPIW